MLNDQLHFFFILSSSSNNNNLGKKKEYYWAPKIKFLIELTDKIVPVTSLEWDRLAESNFTFSGILKNGQIPKAKFQLYCKKDKTIRRSKLASLGQEGKGNEQK